MCDPISIGAGIIGGVVGTATTAGTFLAGLGTVAGAGVGLAAGSAASKALTPPPVPGAPPAKQGQKLPQRGAGPAAGIGKATGGFGSSKPPQTLLTGGRGAGAPGESQLGVNTLLGG